MYPTMSVEQAGVPQVIIKKAFRDVRVEKVVREWLTAEPNAPPDQANGQP